MFIFCLFVWMFINLFVFIIITIGYTQEYVPKVFQISDLICLIYFQSKNRLVWQREGRRGGVLLCNGLIVMYSKLFLGAFAKVLDVNYYPKCDVAQAKISHTVLDQHLISGHSKLYILPQGNMTISFRHQICIWPFFKIHDKAPSQNLTWVF